MNADIHILLKQVVDTYGKDILCNDRLMAILDDEMIFRNYENHRYKPYFRDAIDLGLIGEIHGLNAWDEATSIYFAEKLCGGNNTWESRYAIDCMAYALGLTDKISEVTVNSTTEINQAVGLTETTVPYIAHGSDKCIGTLIPSAMVEPVHKQLNEIADEEGSVADYVMKEMQIKSEQELESKISGEQIDGVALAIKQMSIGRGFIIGDMTGVGKGRQIAMLIKWATLQGCKPVVVTEKAMLFTDLYRDLCDVGYGDLRPFILNNNNEAKIFAHDGFVAYGLPSNDEMDEFRTTKCIPAGYDFLLLTYSQLNRPSGVNWKCESVLETIRNSYLIMDESHNASGNDSNVANFFREAVKAATGVCFSSATFAKYPSSMPIYALKTALGESHISSDTLIKIISNGGPILQEVMAKGLVDSGSMIRRQRDMSEVERRLYAPESPERIHDVKSCYDTAIRFIYDIRNYFNEYVQPALKYMNAFGILAKKYPNIKSATNFIYNKQPKLTTRSFSSLMTPVIRKLLYAIKTQDAIDLTLKELKAGRKPIIQISRTMESTLLRKGNVGTELKSSDFLLTLLDNIGNIFNYTVKATITKGSGKRTSTKVIFVDDAISFDELQTFHGNDNARIAYEELVKKLETTLSGIPLSPIDWFVQNIEAKGYKVGELTQRKVYLRYKDLSKGANGKARIDARKSVDKKALANGFNSGKVDVLIGNSTMASGISLHSSDSFADKRQRVVITWEMQDRVDVQTQFDGRADRTGQISHSAFSIISSSIPAEQRYLMMSSSKQRSMNANVEATQRTDMPCTDILNVYGAQVASEYLRDHPERATLFEDAMQIDLKRPEGKRQFINEFMRTLCLFECDEQEAILSDILERYESLISDLDNLGENELRFNALPLNATLMNRTVFAKGMNNGIGAFGSNADLDEVEVDILRKPLTKDKIIERSADLLSTDEVVERIKAATKQRIISINNYYDSLRTKAIEQLDDLKKRGQKIIPSRLSMLEERANNTDKMAHQIQKIVAIADEIEKLVSNFARFEPVGIPHVLRNVAIIEDRSIIKNVPIGLFLGFKIIGNDVVPSCIKAVFAVNDSRCCIELPLTAVEPLNVILAQTHAGAMRFRLSTVSLSNWNTFISEKKRETAYIVTGNLILGIATAHRLGDNIRDRKTAELVKSMGRGKLISYSDNRGQLRHGYLLPKIYSPSYLNYLLQTNA